MNRIDKKWRHIIRTIIKEGDNNQTLIGGGRKITDSEYNFFVWWIKSERIKKTKSVIFYYWIYQWKHKGNALKFSIRLAQKFLCTDKFHMGKEPRYTL